MAKKRSLSTQKKATWKVFSEYTRRKYADDNGYVSCVTCGATKHYKQMQAGHFIPKKKGNAVYFEGVHPQCYQCNINLGGYGAKYYDFMLKTYGQTEIDRLLELANTTRKFTVDELKQLEDEYKEKLNELLTTR